MREIHQYNVVYDKEYIKEGYIIYQNDYTKFVKIMHTYGSNYMIFANDEYEDSESKLCDFHPIILEIDGMSQMFEATRILAQHLKGNPIYARGDLDQGKTHLVLQKKDAIYEFKIMKDIRYHKNKKYNFALFQIQDTPEGAIAQFYSQLQTLSSHKESEAVKEKMINLKATKKSIH